MPDADSTRSMTNRGLSHSSGLEGPANAGDWLLERQSSQQQQLEWGLHVTDLAVAVPYATRQKVPPGHRGRIESLR